MRSSEARGWIPIYSPEGHDVLTGLWVRSGWQQKISYEVTWLGVPIIQLPEDMFMMQELLHKVRPDVVVETGTAHGGTAVFYASVLELLGRGRVISVDVEIRKYNRLAILSNPLSKRIELVEGSSVDDATLARVKAGIGRHDKVVVALDSNHTKAHVREELERYSPLVSPGCYVVVFDGVMESLHEAPNGRPEWKRDNPAAAVRGFLKEHPEFEVDPYYNRLGPTYAPGGFLRRKA